MKRFLSTLCALCATTLAWAATEVVNGISWNYKISDGKAMIVSDDIGSSAIPQSTSGSIIIPSTLDDCPVTSIGGAAFSGCSGLTSVMIPEGVTSIGNWAFSNCSGLTSVTIPSSVTSIGDRAFSGCRSLLSLTIPSSVTSIGEWAFAGCSGLTSVTIPEGVTSIGGSAFQYCSGLTSVTIPSSVTSIEYQAFSGCSGLTSVTIPEGVTSIGNNAFSGCTGLTSVTISSSVTSIGRLAFEGCSGLTSVTIPEGVTSIGSYALQNCSGLTSVTIPSSVTSIGEYAFSGCSSLASVTIPKGVTSIGKYTFYNCSGLTSITIPSSVTSIGNSAFSDCSGLTSITILEGVTSIGSYAFQNCSGLTSVTIPEGVTSIGSYAFSYCSGLTSVTIPEGVTSIGYWAFYNCFNILEVFFAGAVPEGYADSSLPGKKTMFTKEYAPQWEAVISESYRLPLIDVVATANVTVSAEMTTPRTMTVTYSVASDLPTVKVRAVAFADGVRSFAKIVPVKNGTDVPNGGEVETNTEHTLIWNVFEDWDTDLSKVAIEILVQEGELLPQELITIPAVGDNKAMTITRNTITTKMAFNALLWCIAEGDDTLTNENGIVKVADGKMVAHNAEIMTGESSRYINGKYVYYSVTSLLNYLYGKMGYKVLAGSDLTYAKAATRIELQSSGIN